MAGKSRKQGSRPGTPNTPNSKGKSSMEGPLKGHLGLKSSPFAPTDCKLVSQYMVLDHMSAHYKNLAETKSAIDTSPPKAWMVSQKVRDRARREALKHEMKRRQKWLETGQESPRDSIASSDADRDEMLAQMESINNGAYDELDGMKKPGSLNVHLSDSHSLAGTGRAMRKQDFEMVNERLHNHKMKHRSNVTSNEGRKYPTKGSRVNHIIPSQSLQVHGGIPSRSGTGSGGNSALTTPKQGKGGTTPRNAGGDLLVTMSHKFTEEKAFQPRTLKSHTSTKSRLSQFKYYNPPKRESKLEEVDEPDATPLVQSIGPPARMRHSSAKRSSVRSQILSRPDTPMTQNTESVDWMNETIMSRDLNKPVQSDVPPLDISLDADHMKWLKEQSKKAHIRASHRTSSERASHRTSSERGEEIAPMNGTGSYRINGNDTNDPSTMYSNSRTFNRTFQSTSGEEDLKYLEFIQEVTNDVLDRGIFTNRMLKQVFEIHIERRKRELKVSKMREMMDDLRRDLGIPKDEKDNPEDGVGLASTQNYLRDDLDKPAKSNGQISNGSHNDLKDGVSSLQIENNHGTWQGKPSGTGISASRTKDPMMTTHKFNLTQGPMQTMGREGRPPLPRSGPRKGRVLSNTSQPSVKEETGEFNGTLTGVTSFNGDHGMTLDLPKENGADILTIHHSEDSEVSLTARTDMSGYDELDVSRDYKTNPSQLTTMSADDDVFRPDMTRTDSLLATVTTDSEDRAQDDLQTMYAKTMAMQDENDEDEDTLMDSEPPAIQKRPDPPRPDPPRPSPRKRGSSVAKDSTATLTDTEEWKDDTPQVTNRSGSRKETSMDSASLEVSDLSADEDDF